jgi:SAM-dependent methyltransferase
MESARIGERCYLSQTKNRTIEDHLARYNFFVDFVRGKKVLDIACGEGYGCEIIKNGGAKEVWGADNDSETIERARQKYSGIDFIASEATKTPFADDFFDAVISFETWHHLDEYGKFIPEISRILKPGGLLILSVPNEKVIYLNPFHKKFLTEFYRVDFNKERIRRYLKNHFDVEEWYGQRFVKKIYLNFFVKIFLNLGSFIPLLRKKTDWAFKLADGPAVKPLSGDNARYLIALCRKKN